MFKGGFVVRHEVWRQEYRNHRYMEYLTREELIERTKDVLANMSTLTEKGQLGLHGLDDVGKYWMIVWTHVLEEFVLRYGPYPNGFTDGSLNDAPTVNPTFPVPPSAKTSIDGIGGIKPNQLYKYGQYEYLIKMIKQGRIRIAPASYYSDPSLNKAIRDDELSINVQKRSDHISIKTIKGEKIPTFGSVTYKLSSNTNYFVHCFAAGYTYREFDDFSANACVVISEPRLLFKKMMNAAKKVLPEYDGFASQVKYIDPLNCEPKSVDIFFAKHFKYSYQNEVRVIWLPKKPIDNLEPFFIEIGSMEKYAKIIRI